MKSNMNICPVCKKTFPTLANLKIHLRVHTLEKPFKCAKCDKAFNQQCNLHRHELLHSDLKTHSCEKCGKSFRSKRYLKLHSFTHTGVSRYKCNVCDKNFAQSCGLKCHLLIHTGEKPHICDICGKSFTQQGSLARHKVVHSKTEYKCKECGKSFKHKNKLRVHQRSLHSDEVFPCDVCGKEFNHKSYLQKHMLRHNNTMSTFQCNDCCKRFTQKINLQTHIKNVHLQANVVECAICDSKFNNKYTLERHLLHFHMKEKYTCRKVEGQKTSQKENKLATTDHCVTPRILRKREKVTPSKYSATVDTVNIEEQQQKEALKHKFDTCSKYFTTSENLNGHILTQEKRKMEITSQTKAQLKPETPLQKLYECKICKAQCENMDKLKMHFFTHEKEEMFLLFCEMNETLQIVNGNNAIKTSSESTSSKTNLNDKINKKSKVVTKKSTCSMCKAKFSTIYNRLRHEKMFCVERPREKECPESNTCNKYLSISEKSNRDDLPNEKSELEIISLAKTQQKPETPPQKSYECKICKAQLENVDKLEVHFFTHINEEMFSLFSEMN